MFRYQVPGSAWRAGGTSCWVVGADVCTQNSGVIVAETLAWVRPFFASSIEAGRWAKLMAWQRARQRGRRFHGEPRHPPTHGSEPFKYSHWRAEGDCGVPTYDNEQWEIFFINFFYRLITVKFESAFPGSTSSCLFIGPRTVYLFTFLRIVWIRFGNKGVSQITFIPKLSYWICFMAACVSRTHPTRVKNAQREKPTTTSFSFATPFNVKKWGLDQ